MTSIPRITRRGVSMVEITFALAILTVPVMSMMTTFESNVRGTHFNQQRVAARLVLTDLAGLIRGLPAERFDVLEKGGAPEIDLLLEDRVAALPDHLRADYRKQVQGLFGQITLTREQDVQGLTGLHRFRLTAKLSNGAAADESWLCRPSRRTVPNPAIERR